MVCDSGDLCGLWPMSSWLWFVCFIFLLPSLAPVVEGSGVGECLHLIGDDKGPLKSTRVGKTKRR